MGADLYNHRFRNDTPSIAAAEKEFTEYTALVGMDRTPDQQAHINSLWDKMHPKGYYFRESYNGEGLLNALDLSWWENIIPLCDVHPPLDATDEEIDLFWEKTDINMSAENCQKFIDLLESRKSILDADDYDHVIEGVDFWTREPYSYNLGNLYRERYAELIEFLQLGIRYGGIYASL